ncbi:MAG: radical SAM protein [Planctomycetaceae bacterium]|nr:radical SAM protein [Planctomycetaceae bacterium]
MSDFPQGHISELKRWARLDDDHSNSRMQLIREVENHLACVSYSDDSVHQKLATRLERWRYGILRHVPSSHAPLYSCLDALEALSNTLLGQPARIPRRVYAAVYDESAAVPDLTASNLSDSAKKLTQRWFSERSAVMCEQSDWPIRECDQHLGRRQMALYAPLYLSSYCVNQCSYCGFRFAEPIQRTHLTKDSALAEARVLHRRGIRHVLLVAGDYPRLTSVKYFAEIVTELVKMDFDVSIEVAAQSTSAYSELVDAGAYGVTLYQETYDEQRYNKVHPRGPKASFSWRLEALDRAAEAGIENIAMGVLLGLSDPATEYSSLVRHGWYLQQRFPNVRLSFGLPRIHDTPEGFEIPIHVPDSMLKSLYCALRIAFPRAKLVLSTRESADFRNELARICITQMSAGSSTAPGGYDESTASENGEQFPVHDQRSIRDVVSWLAKNNFATRLYAANEDLE